MPSARLYFIDRPMITSVLFRTLNLLTKPSFVAVVLALLLAAWLLLGNQLLQRLEDNSFSGQAERNRQELFETDPTAASILAGFADKNDQRALLLATYSAGNDSTRPSVLAEMADETVKMRGLPYRARVAALSLNSFGLRDNQARSAFVVSHATACEFLAINGDWREATEYMKLLEQAATCPTVWPIVCDDPLGLVLWSKLSNPNLNLLSFYHRNRDWLADPLAALDLSGDEWTVQSTLEILARHEKTLRIAVVQGELGVYALAVTLTHGSLLNLCFDQYGLDPSEVISVIMFNQDALGERERDPRWIGEKAAWLAQIRQRHPTVWFAAARTPMALRLHRDAPHVSDSLLEQYGAEDIAALIYQHFDETDQVAAAASAIDRFGDLAIYVFARYEDEAFMERLRSYLVDEKIGIRVIPFVVRYGDDAFKRIHEDPKWVDRYFNLDGTARVRALEWVQYIPGGEALQVARNWSNGHPCEWSELGWAAVDVADVALTIASFGGSKTITEPAKTAAKGAKAAVKMQAAAKGGARKARTSAWGRALAESRTVSSKAASRVPRAAEVAKAIRAGTVQIGKSVWQTVKLSAATEKYAYRSLDAWKTLSPVKKVWIYRSLLGVGLYITLTERTIPNLDKITAGIADDIGRAAAGVVTLAGDALAAAITAFTGQLTGRQRIAWLKRLIYWLVSILLLILISKSMFRANRDRQSTVVVRT